MFCLSVLRLIGAYPPACMSYGQEAAPAGRKAKRIIPLRVKSFTHYLKKAVKPSEKHPLLIHRPFFPLKPNYGFSASSGSRKKNQVNPVNPVRKLFALCLNNYELISKRFIYPRQTSAG